MGTYLAELTQLQALFTPVNRKRKTMGVAKAAISAVINFILYIYIYIYICNDVNATHAVIGLRPSSIRVQIHGRRHGNLVFFVLFNMACGVENVCEIILD